MNKLATETLALVLSLLSRKEKVTCLYVCQRWNEIVCSNLYEKLYINYLDEFQEVILCLKATEIWEKWCTN